VSSSGYGSVSIGVYWNARWELAQAPLCPPVASQRRSRCRLHDQGAPRLSDEAAPSSASTKGYRPPRRAGWSGGTPRTLSRRRAFGHHASWSIPCGAAHSDSSTITTMSAPSPVPTAATASMQLPCPPRH
jgi:hypothetical protein